MPLAASDTGHPCHQVVALQGGATCADRQVPEGWAGGLETALVAYVASNPAISDDEDFPRSAWTDESIVNFVTRRFDQSVEPPWVSDHRYRRLDGTYSQRRVKFWEQANKRTDELLGYRADPARDYVLTEVVHCKSRQEIGVRAAVARCAETYLEPIFSLCPAPLVVIVGSAARDATASPVRLPPSFGQRSSSRRDNVLVRTVGDKQRLVVYLPHFSGMEPNRSFLGRYRIDGVELLRAVAKGTLLPQEAAHRLERNGADPQTTET